jgi:hypothetical protein
VLNTLISLLKYLTLLLAAVALCALPASAVVDLHCDVSHAADVQIEDRTEQERTPADQDCLDHAAHHCCGHFAFVFDGEPGSLVPALTAKSVVRLASEPRLIRKVLDGPERPPRS